MATVAVNVLVIEPIGTAASTGRPTSCVHVRPARCTAICAPGTRWSRVSAVNRVTIRSVSMIDPSN